VEEMAKVVTLATQRALEKLYPSRDCTNWYLQRSIYQFSTLRAGIAGYDRPGLAPSVEIALGRLFNIPKGTNLHITNDIDLLASAMMKHSGLRTGIVLLAGTGSVAMSYEIKTGVPVRTARSGGWGWILGDGGSGFDLGRKGVQATLSALEEARISTSSRDPATKGVLKPFHLDIMKSLGVPEEWITFDVLSHILKENSESFDDLKSKIAGVALTVLNAASSDLEAIQIVHSGAEALVSILFTLVRYACVTPEKSVLILAGGLMKTQMYRGVVLQKLRREGVHFPIVEIIEDAAIFGVQSLKTLA
jgi:N-acetylmuramic acid 6-phosphate etherase